MSDNSTKELQNLRQDKVIQAGAYEKARADGDSVGMRRARKEIERINKEIIRISRGRS